MLDPVTWLAISGFCFLVAGVAYSLDKLHLGGEMVLKVLDRISLGAGN